MSDPPFEQFVATRSQSLIRFAYVLCGGDAHRAEDLVQAALAKVWRRWSAIVSGGHPEAYLRRVIVSQEMSWRRRRASSETVTALVPEPTYVADVADQVGAADAVWRTVAMLPPGQRAVLVLRYLEDWPDPEIATVLGCTEATVRSQAARGLAQLRQLSVPAQRDSAKREVQR